MESWQLFLYFSISWIPNKDKEKATKWKTEYRFIFYSVSWNIKKNIRIIEKAAQILGTCDTCENEYTSTNSNLIVLKLWICSYLWIMLKKFNIVA